MTLATLAAATMVIASPQGPALAPLPPVTQVEVEAQNVRTLSAREQTAREARRMEWTFQALNAADAATTCIVLGRGGRELNPLYGSKPSCGKVIAIKAGIGALHWFLIDRAIRGDPAIAKQAVRWSIILQAGVVGWNMTQVF